jgi:Mn2+/Fe2+ NRAMP family transporter
VPLLAAMMITASRESVMGEFSIGRSLRVFGWITTAVMAAAALTLLL